jgi:hypothetical protein
VEGSYHKGPHRKSAAASRDADDGLRLCAGALGRLPQAADLPHIDLRFRERQQGKDFFDLTSRRRQPRAGEKSCLKPDGIYDRMAGVGPEATRVFGQERANNSHSTTA